MFMSSTQGFKEPTHFLRRVGHEDPIVMAVLFQCIGRYRALFKLDLLNWMPQTTVFVAGMAHNFQVFSQFIN